MIQDKEMLLKALELANMHAATAPVVVARAQEYYNFLIGEKDEVQTEEAPIADAGGVEPSTRRRRKAAEEKQEVQSTEKANAVAAAQAKAQEMQDADPALEYKKIQTAVVALVNTQGGKDKVLKIFDQFGVTTALNLKPEQYAEVISLLQNELAEAPLA